MSDVIAAYEPCGCCAGVYVIDLHPADAYSFAAKEARKGLRIETLEVETWRARGLRCADHPKGPPWWKSNGGSGRRPAEYESQTSLGLT